MYIHISYMYTCMWSSEDSIINHSPLHILRRDLSLNSELADSSRVAGQQDSGIVLSLPPTLGLQPYNNVPDLSYTGPHACTANSLLTEPSPLPFLYTFKHIMYKKPIEVTPFRQLFGVIVCSFRYFWVHRSLWITIHSTFIQHSWVPTASQALCCVLQRVTAQWKRSH